MEEIEALVFLGHKMSGAKARELIEKVGSAQEALKLVKWAGEGKEDLELAQKEGITLVSYRDKSYPGCFLKLQDPPLVLYIRGEITPADSQGLAIVGTRIATLYGKEMAEKIAQEVVGYGLTIISGLARGIDTSAHLGALKGGRTIAFIGSGLSSLYPRENEKLSEQISKNGAVISEYPMKTAPAKHLFPRRNRLIAAFCEGIFLAEAPIKSGAMITLEMAQKLNKKCFALPGRADVESFRGNHLLIKEKKALLVENGQEMVSILQPEKGKLSFHSKMSLSFLDENEHWLLSLFPSEEIGFEELVLRTKLPVAKLSAKLMSLVLKGAIREFPGRLFKKA